MVVPFIFSVLVAKPTWNVSFFGPYFLGAAALSGVAAVVILAAVFRKVFGWEDILELGIFKELGGVMLVLIPIYTYFTFLEQFTSQYVRATPELTISDYLLTGPYAGVFWFMMILSFILPFLL
jgi:molybdopterin-containing oxidoreductase family membrane subunit